MFNIAGKGEATIKGGEAVSFFKKSGLPMDKMKNIWSISAKSSIEYLTREEFYVALRLIAYHQNNIDPSA
jgi:hypothetical protein